MIATVVPWTSRPQYLQRCAGAWWAIDLSLRTVRRRAISPDAPVWVGRLTAAPWLRRCVFAIWFRSTFLWVPGAVGLSVEAYTAAMARRGLCLGHQRTGWSPLPTPVQSSSLRLRIASSLQRPGVTRRPSGFSATSVVCISRHCRVACRENGAKRVRGVGGSVSNATRRKGL